MGNEYRMPNTYNIGKCLKAWQINCFSFPYKSIYNSFGVTSSSRFSSYCLEGSFGGEFYKMKPDTKNPSAPAKKIHLKIKYLCGAPRVSFRIYRQSWAKTQLKASNINWSYMYARGVELCWSRCNIMDMRRCILCMMRQVYILLQPHL